MDQTVEFVEAEEDIWKRVTGVDALAESRQALDRLGYGIGRKFDAFFGARGAACDVEETRAAFRDDWARLARLEPDSAPHPDLRPGATSDDLHLIALLYLYERCAEEWERVVDHCRIETLISAVNVDSFPFRDGRNVRPVARRFKLMFETLGIAMRVERRMNAGCAASFRTYASDIVGRIKQARPKLEPVDPAVKLYALYLWQERRIWSYDHFFTALTLSGGLVESWNRDHATFKSYARNFAGEIESRQLKLSKLGPERLNQGFASELDAHLKLIGAMNAFGDVSGVRLKECKLVYCFPFAVCGASVRELMEAQDTIAWGSVEDGHSRTLFLSGRPNDILTADILPLSSSGPEGKLPLGRRIGIKPLFCNPIFAAAAAPDTLVRSAPQIELRPEIRLLRTGNHYLRFELSETSYRREGDAAQHVTAHDIYRAMRRASPACGEEPFLIEGAAEDGSDAIDETNLVRLAQDIVASYVAALDAALPDTEISSIVDFTKSHHLVISARESGIGEETSADVAGKVEALLQSHVQGPAIMLEQWLARPSAGEGAVVARVPVDDIEGGHMTASSNTTFIALPDAPNFIYMDYEDLAEFAATMDSVYFRWNRELDHITRANSDMLTALQNETAESGGIDRLAQSVREIDRSAVMLNAKIADAIRDREWLNSTEIVSTAVARRKLDQLVGSTIVARLERDMARKIEAAEKIQAALTSAARSRFRHFEDAKRRLDQDSDTRLQFVVLVLAVIQILEIFMPDADLRVWFAAQFAGIGNPQAHWFAVTSAVSLVYLVVGGVLGVGLHQIAKRIFRSRA